MSEQKSSLLCVPVEVDEESPPVVDEESPLSPLAPVEVDEESPPAEAQFTQTAAPPDVTAVSIVLDDPTHIS